MRVKKNCPPFPTLHRLHRHVREIHVHKGNGKVIPPAERSKLVNDFQNLHTIFVHFKNLTV